MINFDIVYSTDDKAIYLLNAFLEYTLIFILLYTGCYLNLVNFDSTLIQGKKVLTRNFGQSYL